MSSSACLVFLVPPIQPFWHFFVNVKIHDMFLVLMKCEMSGRAGGSNPASYSKAVRIQRSLTRHTTVPASRPNGRAHKVLVLRHGFVLSLKCVALGTTDPLKSRLLTQFFPCGQRHIRITAVCVVQRLRLRAEQFSVRKNTRISKHLLPHKVVGLHGLEP